LHPLTTITANAVAALLYELGPTSVLVVEDNPENREMIVRQLTKGMARLGERTGDGRWM